MMEFLGDGFWIGGRRGERFHAPPVTDPEKNGSGQGRRSARGVRGVENRSGNEIEDRKEEFAFRPGEEVRQVGSDRRRCHLVRHHADLTVVVVHKVGVVVEESHELAQEGQQPEC